MINGSRPWESAYRTEFVKVGGVEGDLETLVEGWWYCGGCGVGTVINDIIKNEA